MTALHSLAILLLCFPACIHCISVLWWLWRHRYVRLDRRSRRAGTNPAIRRLERAERDKKLLYLCAHLDGAGCRPIAEAFNRWHCGVFTVGRTTVWEFMRDHAGLIRERRRQRKRQRPCVIPAGHAWALDLTFIRSPFGTTFTVLGIIDAGSRRLLRLKVVPRKCAFTILGHLLIAIGEHGVPRWIRTDNEAMFLSAMWRMTLKALGITHRRGPPRQPWRNGRIERFFGTLKSTLRGHRFASERILQAALDRFTNWYNALRPHQGLNGLTPNEAWFRVPAHTCNAHDLRPREGALVRELILFNRWRSRPG